MRFNLRLVGAALLGLCFSSAAFGDALLHSWEGSLEGWVVGSPAHTLAVGASGVTDGTSSLQVGHPGANTNGSSRTYSGGGAFEIQAATNFFTHNTLSVDVTRPTTAGTFPAQVRLLLSYRNTSNAFPSISSEDGADAVTGRITFSNTETGTKTLVWNYGDNLVTPMMDATYFLKLFITTRTNGSAPETLFFDNMRFTNPVPEPASAAIVGLGGITALARRRRA